ncbi:MAG: DNA repair protein RecO [Leptospirales bacterium]
MEQEALILRSVRYSEHDRVVTFFSAQEGLLTGFARGSAGLGNRFGASFEPLTLSHILGRHHLEGTLFRLHKASIVNAFSALKSDLDCFYWAGLAVRVLLSLLPPAHPEPFLFDLSIRYLDALSIPENSPATTWIRFASQALGMLGYGIHFRPCSACQSTEGTGGIVYQVTDGRILCLSCASGDESPLWARTDSGTILLVERMGGERDCWSTKIPLVHLRSATSFLDQVFSVRIPGWKATSTLPLTIR